MGPVQGYHVARPISVALPLASAALLAMVLPSFRRARQEAFKEEA